MRRSRRLSGLEPAPIVPEALMPSRKRAAKAGSRKKTTTNRSSSKKENVKPTRSARQTEKSTTRTKRTASASTRAPSRKKASPKRTTTPKRGRKNTKAPAASARSRSGRRSTQATGSKKKTATTRSRSAKRATTTKTPKRSAKKTTSKSSIHRKPTQSTPIAAPRDEGVEEKKMYEPEGEDDLFPPPPIFLDEDDEDDFAPVADDEWKPTKMDWAEADEEEIDLQSPPPSHSMDFRMVGIVVCLIALYLMSFCRSMSCSALVKLPWLSSMLTDFDVAATAVTSFVLYVVSLAYCRTWLQSGVRASGYGVGVVFENDVTHAAHADGFMTTAEGSFITFHFVHGLLVILHLVSCTIVNPDNKQSNCIESIVALSIGFYGAAWAMQLKFGMQFLRNSIALAYVCLFYYHGKNVFGLVLMLAAKSVFWMTGAHMAEIINNERWSMIDVVITVGCAFLAYLVPARG